VAIQTNAVPDFTACEIRPIWNQAEGKLLAAGTVRDHFDSNSIARKEKGLAAGPP